MKGLLFTPEMARAVCEGRKTQTRRVVSPQPDATTKSVLVPSHSRICSPVEYMEGREAPTGPSLTCPYRAGERVCLLTTWAVHSMFEEVKPCALDKVAFAKELDLWHAGMSVPKYKEAGKLRPGRFMPNQLRPLMPQLEIVSVSAERVQDISEEDARAEGIERFDLMSGGKKVPPTWRDYEQPRYDPFEWFGRPVDSFKSLWDSINSKRGHGWQQNPWVWVVTFGRVEA